MQGRLASETLSALAGTLAARPPSILFDPHATRVDPHQALISTASYQTTFDRTGAMLSGYDLTGGAGPTLRTFSYGVDGMPFRIAYGSKSVDSYFDDTGSRVLKFGAQTTVYVGPHFEVRGGVRHRYVFANGIRIALLTPSATYYFHGDHLGSTRAITNGAGTAVWTGSYEPFGRLSSETGTRVSPYLFTGKELDGETGLYYFGARYYDPSTGMFTSADSVLARPYDPQSLNRYAYVGGKPLSRFDPDGHNWSDFMDWVGDGLRWLGQHSDGGFGVPVVSANSNGEFVVPLLQSGSERFYRTYVELEFPGPTMGSLLTDPLISKGQVGGVESGYSLDRAISHLEGHAAADFHGSKRRCAAFVCDAIDAGLPPGVKMARVNLAKDFGDALMDAGFVQIAFGNVADGFQPARGDVMLLDTYPGQATGAGHMMMFNGLIWISDYKQTAMWTGPSFLSNNVEFRVYRGYFW